MNTVWSIMNIIFTLIIVSSFWFLKSYIVGIPQRIHDKNIEELKNTLERELSKFEITEQNLYLKKIEVYEIFLSAFYNLTDAVKQENKGNTKFIKDGQKQMNDFLKKSLFYCDDKTFDKVRRYRRFSNQLDIKNRSEEDGARMIMLVTDILLQMRISLGYDEYLSRESFLYFILNDWDTMKEKPHFKEALNYQYNNE